MAIGKKKNNVGLYHIEYISSGICSTMKMQTELLISKALNKKMLMFYFTKKCSELSMIAIFHFELTYLMQFKIF